MIDFFIIFSRTGLVLFTYSITGVLKGDPISSFLQNVLIEGRSGEKQFFFNQYGVKWRLENQLGLVFAAVFHKIIIPNYLEDLFDGVLESFCAQYEGKIQSATGKFSFEKEFERILRKSENKSLKGNKNVNGFKKGSSNQNKKDKSSTGNHEKKQKKKKKEKRAWNHKETLSKDDAESLNKFSGNTESKIAMNDDVCDYSEQVELDKPEEEDTEAWNSQLFSFFDKISGKKPLSKEDLAAGLKKMETQLISKNVSSDICHIMINDVERSLLGKKMNSFTRGSSYAISNAVKISARRILTSNKSTDLLSMIRKHDKKKGVFSVVFVGVNGVGKSTSLSKICYYLKSNNLKVMICACDTFRSGAVEQLKVHAKNLGVEVFESGYGTDPASVAMKGRKYAEENDYDVILIDTAGRMQNNIPLMREISKLVRINSPNLLLFVAEASVGNDGINQLTEFNKCLLSSSNRNGIDGLILTKFDTVDDKVGAIVSLVHKSGKPVFFVGTGQKYTNLNRLNISKVIKSLLK